MVVKINQSTEAEIHATEKLFAYGMLTVGIFSLGIFCHLVELEFL
jgi:hypothetical protein